jgi:hypothetical protein
VGGDGEEEGGGAEEDAAVLRVAVLAGKGLIPMDRSLYSKKNNTSDPYVRLSYVTEQGTNTLNWFILYYIVYK